MSRIIQNKDINLKNSTQKYISRIQNRNKSQEFNTEINLKNSKQKKISRIKHRNKSHEQFKRVFQTGLNLHLSGSKNAAR